MRNVFMYQFESGETKNTFKEIARANGYSMQDRITALINNDIEAEPGRVAAKKNYLLGVKPLGDPVAGDVDQVVD